MIEMEEKLIGLENVDRALHELPEEMARGVVLDALRDGANFLLGKVRANISAKFRSRSGDMLRNVRVETSIEPGKRGGSIVRAKVHAAPFPSKAPYPFFWEKGFQHIGHSKKLRRELRRITYHAKRAGGDVRAAKAGVGKFMRREAWGPAFEAYGHAALAMIVARIRSGFDAAVAQARERFGMRPAA